MRETIRPASDFASGEPGIYRDVPFAEYAACKAVNASALKWGALSMAHMRAYMAGEIDDDSPAKKFGRMVHLRILEPDEYTASLVTAQQCSAVKGDGSRCQNVGKFLLDDAWFCGVRGHRVDGAEEPDIDVITQEEAAAIEKIAQALHDADCMRLLQSPGWSECVVVWEMYGVLCKGRLDRLSADFSKIVDLKKCQRGKGSIDDCQKAIGNYNYHVPAAMYSEAIRSLTGVTPEFVWTFVEDKPPHVANIIKADEQTIEMGLFDAQQTIQRWARACRTERYPGYVIGDYIPRGGLPLYRRREYPDNVLTGEAIERADEVVEFS